jgi:hypothetical protein
MYDLSKRSVKNRGSSLSGRRFAFRLSSLLPRRSAVAAGVEHGNGDNGPVSARCTRRRRRCRRRDRDGFLRMLNGYLFRLGSGHFGVQIALKLALAHLSPAEFFLQLQGDGERRVPGCAEPGDGDPVGVYAQLFGMIDEVEHCVHCVFHRGGERVLGRTSIVHTAHDSVSARDDGCCLVAAHRASSSGQPPWKLMTTG